MCSAHQENNIYYFPLSFAQQRLWFFDQLIPGASIYNVFTPVRLSGPLNIPALEQSFNELIRRHESLRTTFRSMDGTPMQAVMPAWSISIPVIDLEPLAEAEQTAELQRLIQSEVKQPFDLGAGPLLRVLLLRLGPTEHVLVQTLHHIITDGWSMGLLIREISVLYEAFQRGQASPLPPLEIQYADFAAWQREWLQGEVLEEQLAYWRKQLSGSLPLLDLPTDFPRPAVQSFQGRRHPLTIPGPLARELAALSQREGVTLYMTLLAAFQVLLHRYTGQIDLLIGMPSAGRTQRETENLIGFFVNTLVLRTDLSGNPGFRELLGRVREVCLGAYAHQDLPFEMLVEELQPQRDLSRPALFQVLFVLQNAPLPSQSLQDLTLSPVAIDSGTAMFDLSLDLMETADGISGAIEYSNDLFDAATIERMAGHFQTILASVAADPQQCLAEITLLTQAEQRLLQEWNPLPVAQPQDQLLHVLIQQQAARTPDTIAVRFQDCTLSYRALDEQSNQVAHYLQSRGVMTGSRVGLCVDRSLDLVVGLLGILKAGATLVPLDPAYPADRLAYILENAEAAMLVTQEHHLAQFATNDQWLPPSICLDRERAALANMPTSAPVTTAGPDDVAYMIYTSGTTGRPKGVQVAQRQLLHTLRGAQQTFGFQAGDVLPWMASVAFDIAFFELFTPLLVGGTSLVLAQAEVLDLPQLVARLREVTLLHAVPSLMRQLVDTVAEQGAPAGFERLRQVFVGGEAVPPGLVAELHRVFPQAQVTILYGPTEATIICSCHTTTAGEALSGNLIGTPLPNVQLRLYDAYWQQVPIGVAGELYIGGAGVTCGYWRQPELSAEKFVEIDGQRWYRSGDLARYRANGTIEFLGRIDQQVKIRGFRIELGEIEAVLAQHPAVRQATVLAQPAAQGEQRLVAYVVEEPRHREPAGSSARNQEPGATGEGLAPDLRAFLQRRLPEYMVPSAFVLLDALPLNPNGKVDRKALPMPEVARPDLNTEYRAPSSTLERRLTEIWQEVLGLDQVGIADNFFDLGGHSLLLVKLRTKIAEQLHRDIPIMDLFRYPTVSALASYLGDQPEAMTAAEHAGDRLELVDSQPPVSSEIAIIGMAGRFPGARTVQHFWDNLRSGVESITQFSEEELRAAGVDPALLARPEYVRYRGVMDDIDAFDASFFDIPPREAEIIDPQQRVFLECIWEVLEDAGYTPAGFPGRIGIVAGSTASFYLIEHILPTPRLIEATGVFPTITGNNKDSLATRASYKLNLKGPSLAVSTACSTSLVAVHLACRLLQQGECELALAGGVSIRLLAKEGYLYQEGGIMSPDGHCRAFDAQAQGTIEGDGVGIVALKPLAAALRDGDHIYAVIKGSAINNDGSDKIGYTAPAIQGQAEVILAAQRAAGVDPATISYVEAHGTGTPLGDPIEVAALTQAFQTRTDNTQFCAIGSVKTNIGHLDAAAGVAGLIKTALSLHHKQTPPSLHFQQPNPQIDFANTPFYVNNKLRDWTSDGQPRRAGVSSFGIGGTNAHVILEEAPPAEPSGPSRPWQLLLLSAKSEQALEQATAQLIDQLEQQPDERFADAIYTLQVGRTAFNQRRVLVCQNREDAIAALREAHPTRVMTAARESASAGVVFMFPGQGAQYVNMARDLYEHEPDFRKVVDQCCDLIQPHLGLDLRALLYPQQDDRGAEQRLTQTEIAQPALFIIEYALAQLLIGWGITPAAMVGHSIGEYVAATLAGVFALEDALRLVAIRGRLVQQLPSGAMLAVSLPAAEIEPLLDSPETPHLALAAINAAARCVVAGPRQEIEQLAQRLAARNVETQRLHTSHAFHSPMMEPIVGEFADVVRGIQLHPPRRRFLSNVTGSWITAEEATDPSYWARHLRQTVRFAAAVEHLVQEPGWTLIEIGPGRVLSSLARQHPAKAPGQLVLPSLPHPQDQVPALAFLLQTLGRLWLAGVAISWNGFYRHERRHRTPLPTYPFERQRFWIDRPRAEQSTVAAPRRSSQRKADPADWFYVPLWKQTVAPQPSKRHAPQPSGGWLIFADDLGLGAQIAEQARHSAEVVIVQRGPQFAVVDSHSYQINPCQRQDYDRLLEDLRSQGRQPQVIAHLWSITPEPAQQTARAIEARLASFDYYSPIFLAQALADQQLTDPIRLAIISNGLHYVTGSEALAPEKALLLGPSRTIGQEFPHISSWNIDVMLPVRGNGQAARLAAQLVAEISAAPGDPIVAYRGGQRWVQIFEPMRLERAPERPARLRERGTYLITGGLGGMGLEFAAYLAREVKAQLILTGRSAFPARAEWDRWLAAHEASDPTSDRIRRLQKLEADGAEVLVCQADVADMQQMQEVVSLAAERFGAIHGVIHTAGVGGGGIIQLQTLEQMAEVFAPKVQGTLVLAELFEQRGLDFMVLCSSLRAIIGGFGRSEYNAANAFQDHVARSIADASGSWTVAIDWATWTDVGMAARMNDGQEQPALLNETVSPEEGVDALCRILDTELTQVALAPVDLHTLIEHENTLVTSKMAELLTPALNAHPRPALSSSYAPPQQAHEQTLAALWQELLGIDSIGIHDNFFELGGDSITSLQLTTRARPLGLNFTPRQVFEHPTIAELAALLGRTVTKQAEQGLVTGPVPLTPIQQSFFEQELHDPHHWNLAALFTAAERLDHSLLEAALQHLAQQHDLLRARFRREPSGWQQMLGQAEEKLAVEHLRLTEQSPAARAAAIERIATELQASLSLESGPLLRAALIDLGPDQPQRLLLAIHHLVVDFPSWRVLLEDLQTAYRQISTGQPVALPAKTSSYKQWAERLVEYAQSEPITRDLAYWSRVGDQAAPRLLLDNPAGDNTVGSTDIVSVRLAARETQALLQQVARAEDAQVSEILLAALAWTFAGWTDDRRLLVDLESNGREALFDDLDLSRTVGWFTNLYPVCLNIEQARTPQAAVQTTKQQLRSIPNYGLSYSLLRYLHPQTEQTRALSDGAQAQISFLYLGPVDETLLPGESWLQLAPEPSGPSQSPRGSRRYVFEITASIVDSQLDLSWRYSRQLHHRDTVVALGERYLESLRLLLNQAEQVASTAFPHTGLSQQGLDSLLGQLSLSLDDDPYELER